MNSNPSGGPRAIQSRGKIAIGRAEHDAKAVGWTARSLGGHEMMPVPSFQGRSRPHSESEGNFASRQENERSRKIRDFCDQ